MILLLGELSFWVSRESFIKMTSSSEVRRREWYLLTLFVSLPLTGTVWGQESRLSVTKLDNSSGVNARTVLHDVLPRKTNVRRHRSSTTGVVNPRVGARHPNSHYLRHVTRRQCESIVRTLKWPRKRPSETRVLDVPRRTGRSKILDTLVYKFLKVLLPIFLQLGLGVFYVTVHPLPFLLWGQVLRRLKVKSRYNTLVLKTSVHWLPESSWKISLSFEDSNTKWVSVTRPLLVYFSFRRY